MALKNLLDMVQSGVKAFQTIEAKRTLGQTPGASGGAQTPDSGGMGTAKQRQQGGPNQGVGLKSTPVPSNPNATFSTLGDNSIVERARAFSAQRQARSPLRRQTPSGPTPFAQRKANKERERFYSDIMDQAGAGPNKDISLKNALGIIAQMEGDRMGDETSRRGQDIGAETRDLDRQNQRELGFNRQRIQEVLGQEEIANRSRGLDIDESQFEAKEGRLASEFGAKQAFAQEELAQDFKLGEMRSETELMKEKAKDARAKSEALREAYTQWITKDEVTGDKRYPVTDEESQDLDAYLRDILKTLASE